MKLVLLLNCVLAALAIPFAQPEDEDMSLALETRLVPFCAKEKGKVSQRTCPPGSR